MRRCWFIPLQRDPASLVGFRILSPLVTRGTQRTLRWSASNSFIFNLITTVSVVSLFQDRITVKITNPGMPGYITSKYVFLTQ
jgi:hypothetical protein